MTLRVPSQAMQLLADHGRFPSGGSVPFDVAEALIATARKQALEEAAKVAESYATCGCNGKHGPCMIDDPANAIASEIRAIGSQNDG